MNRPMTTNKPTWHQSTLGKEGQSFVWLHGWGQDSRAMERLAGLLGTSGQHRLFDQPGFGKTPMLAEGAGTADYADALATELNGMGSGPHVFIGHSFGGRVSLQMAARHPHLVKAIILIAGAGLKKRRSPLFKVRATFLRTLGKLAGISDKVAGTTFRDAYVARFGSADYKNAGDLRATFVTVVNEDLTLEAKQLRCPALLIYGSEDTETPPEFGRRFENLMPIARFEEVKGFGHLDILTRGAYQCEALIKTFLGDLKDDG